MPNLIVFLFNHLYFVFYMGFYCMGCVWEKVWRLKRLLKIKWISREVSWQAFPRSLYPHYPHIGRSAFLGENLRYYPWEVDSLNTYHTHSECKVRFWFCCEALEEAICLVDAIGLNCVIRRVREDTASSS